MREFLFQYLKPNTIGCEVGVWQGQFSQQLHTSLQPKKLYLIDPWIVRTDYERRWYSSDSITQDKLDQLHQHVTAIFESHSNVTIIRDFFENAANQIKDDELDWIYIDGDHSEQEVYKDLVNAYRKVKCGGYIIGDDFSWVEPITKKQSVKDALEKFLAKYATRINILTIHNNQFITKKV